MSVQVFGPQATAVELYEAYFGNAPSNPIFNNFVSTIGTTDGGALSVAIAAQFSGLSNADFATKILSNLQVNSSTVSQATLDELTPAVAAYLGSVGTANRGIVVVQLIHLLSGLENDGTFGTAATAFNNATSASFAYASDPAHTVPSDGTTPPLNLVFTNGIDALAGAGGNDIFTATLTDSSDTTTFSTGDAVNGAGSFDTVKIVASSTDFEDNLASFTSVEKVEVQNASGGTLSLDAGSWGGVQEYALTGNGTVKIGQISEEFTTASITNFSTTGIGGLGLGVADDVFAGSSDTITVNLNKAGSNVDNEIAGFAVVKQSDGPALTSVIENLVVNSQIAASGDQNYLAFLDESSTIQTITVEGGAGVAVAIADSDLTKLTSIDASAATGTVDFRTHQDVHVHKDFTYTGSQGTDKLKIHDASSTGVTITVNSGTSNDTVELSGAALANTKYAIDLGAGDDSLRGTNKLFAPGATGNTIDGGDGTDTLAVALVNVGNSTEFKNFEILDIAGINSTTTFDAAIMPGNTFTGVAVTGDTISDASIINTGFSSGLSVTGVAGDHNLTLGFTGTGGTADALNIVFNDATKGADHDLDFATLKVNGIETFNITSSGSDKGDFNEIDNLSSNTVTTINVTGSNDFELDGITNLTAGLVTSFTKLDASAATGDNSFSLGDLFLQETATAKVAVSYSILLGSGDDDVQVASAAANAKATTVNVDMTKGGDDTIDLNGFFSSTAAPATAVVGSIVNITGANAGDVLDVAGGTNVAATLGAAQSVGTATNTAQAIDLAIAAGAVAGNDAVWFTLGGNTYIAVDLDASNTYTTADTVVKLVGTHDLTTATFNGDVITLTTA